MDISGHGRTLTNNGTATLAKLTNGTPYGVYNGTTQWHSRADEAGLDITGALSFGGWYYLDNLSASRALITKYTAVGQQAYAILFSSVTGFLEMRVSVDGTNNTVVQSTVTPAAAGWHFFGGRFTPSTEMAIWIDETKTINTTSIPASIFNSNAGLLLGGLSAAASLAGRLALCFLCADPVDDSLVGRLYKMSRTFFGV